MLPMVSVGPANGKNLREFVAVVLGVAILVASGLTAVAVGSAVDSMKVVLSGSAASLAGTSAFIVLWRRNPTLFRAGLRRLADGDPYGLLSLVSRFARGASLAGMMSTFRYGGTIPSSSGQTRATLPHTPIEPWMQPYRAWRALTNVRLRLDREPPDVDAVSFGSSGLFDAEHYRSQIGDDLSDASTEQLVSHYLSVGWRQGLEPSAGIDPHVISAVLGIRGAEPLCEFLALLAHTAPPMMQLIPGASEQQLRWAYVASGAWSRDGVCIVRVVGNDLPPRHASGQSVRNVRFILENERLPEGVTRSWVLNRITEPDVKAQLISLLEQAQESVLQVPFVAEDYRDIGYRFGDFSFSGLSWDGDVDLDALSVARAWGHVYGDKNRYVMNNNGARNIALAAFQDDHRWILPWDGNTFMTEAGWSELLGALRSEPWRPVVVVPMARVTENAVLLDGHFRPEASEEPQLVFRSDVTIAFDESYRYGRRTKVELLLRLGVPGPWERWSRSDPWEQPLPPLAETCGWREVSWVARLASGADDLERSIQLRGIGRREAVRAHLHGLDVQLLAERSDHSRLVVLDAERLTERRARWRAEESDSIALVDELITQAERIAGLTPPSSRDKTSIGPSGDPHDYFSAAPYWRPHPRTRSGLPYVRRGGERVPGTGGDGGPGSERYDRWALQRVFDETFTLTLAASFSEDPRHWRAAAQRVRTWFIDPTTRMNPHLGYAQVRLGHDDDRGRPQGIIDFCGVYYFLDAVRLLCDNRNGHGITDMDESELRGWFVEYLAWLSESPQGTRERASNNHHGTWYDLQHATISAWLGDHAAVQSTIVRASERAVQQFAADGSQPAELARATPLHYLTYNLAGWRELHSALQRLSGVADPLGLGSTLETAQSWIIEHREDLRPTEPDFDTNRIGVLDHSPPDANWPHSINWGLRMWSRL